MYAILAVMPSLVRATVFRSAYGSRINDMRRRIRARQQLTDTARTKGRDGGRGNEGGEGGGTERASEGRDAWEGGTSPSSERERQWQWRAADTAKGKPIIRDLGKRMRSGKNGYDRHVPGRTPRSKYTADTSSFKAQGLKLQASSSSLAQWVSVSPRTHVSNTYQDCPLRRGHIESVDPDILKGQMDHRRRRYRWRYGRR